MAYTYLAADLATGAPLADLPLHGVRWGRRLNGSGPFQASLKFVPPVTDQARMQNATWKDATDRKRRVIYVLRDGTPMGVWLIHERRYDIATQTVAIRGLELLSYLDERIYGYVAPWHLSLRTVGPDVPVQVAVDIIDQVAADMQLDTSSVIPPTAGDTVSYEGRLADGKRFGSIISDFAKAEAPMGFDYRVDLVGQHPRLTRRLVMGTSIGADIGLIAKLTRPDGQGNIRSGGITEDSRRANYVVALGEGDGATRATGEAIGTDWEPRVSTSITVQDEADPTALDTRAAAYLRLVEHMTLPEITLRSDQVDAQLGTFNPGDVGQVVIEKHSDPWWPDGAWLTQRVIGFDVDVPDSHAGETISFQFDDPAGDF